MIVKGHDNFRPRDWPERVCGFIPDKYKHLAQPIMVDNVKCLQVDEELRDKVPYLYEYFEQFIKDNGLEIL